MNFQKLWENMKGSKETEQPLDGAIASVIRSGLGRSEDFWDDFILVLNSSEGLSKLLDIPQDKISTWRDKIQKAMEMVKVADSDKESGKNNKIIKTGIESEELE